jgi:two-component system, OmpR family, phosphate regulon response regulator PhoB
VDTLPSRDPTQPKTILVVEDDPSLRKLVSRRLQQMGLEAVEVDSGEDALSWLSEHEPPCLVCLDLALPSMSGFRVCEQIRAAPRTRGVPVLVMTARTSMQDHTFALEVGANAFLEKPFKLKDFESEVNGLLQTVA